MHLLSLAIYILIFFIPRTRAWIVPAKNNGATVPLIFLFNCLRQKQEPNPFKREISSKMSFTRNARRVHVSGTKCRRIDKSRSAEHHFYGRKSYVVCTWRSSMSALYPGPELARLSIPPTATLPSCLWSRRIFRYLPGSRLTDFHRDAG